MVTIYGIIEKHFKYKVGSFAFFDIFCSIFWDSPTFLQKVAIGDNRPNMAPLFA